jgi:hypothetical protein
MTDIPDTEAEVAASLLSRNARLVAENRVLLERVTEGITIVALLVAKLGGTARITSLEMALIGRQPEVLVHPEPLTGDLIIRVKDPT